MNLDEKLIQYRREREISQEALAEQLGVSRQAISKWETGESMPELSNLLAICKIFDTTPNELFGYEAVPTLTTESAKRKSPVWLTVLLVVSLVLNLLLSSAIGLYIYHAYDEHVNAVIQPQGIPEDFGFREISYRIIEVNEDQNTLEIVFRPTATKESYVYGVAVTGSLVSDLFYGELGEDGLVRTEIVIKRYALAGDISLFTSSEGVNISYASYSYRFPKDGSTYSVIMTETFE